MVNHIEDGRDPELVRVLESAARLQWVVPDAVPVGGSAAAMYPGHRRSFDHDHVLSDLRERFDAVLEAIENEGGWVTNRVTPGKVILGRLGDIEAGVRQMIRSTPLEVAEVVMPSGRVLKAPTPDETLRVKGFLIVRRNQTRDFLDVVALADRYGVEHSGRVLAAIDTYYADQRGAGDGIATQLARQLADPRPQDASTTRELTHYKALAKHWQRWATVVDASRSLAQATINNSQQPRVAMTSVPLRNVDLDPDTPVEAWPFEVVQTLIERGGLSDWRLLIKEIQRAPWGATSQRVEESLSISRPYGTSELFERAIAIARQTTIAAEKAEVSREVGELVVRSRLSKAEFAGRIGTSPSRLSTYLSGQVMPSAALMVRMRHLADSAGS